MKHLIIINGPNLNLVGKREPHIYGTIGFNEFVPQLKEKYQKIKITYHQSNHEGDLIDWLHQYGFNSDGIILNPGAYTHTSIALADAIKAIEVPVIEVHLSNIYEREDFRHNSFITKVCVVSFTGMGLQGYISAIEYLLE